MFGILIDPLVCDQNTAAAKKPQKHTHTKNLKQSTNQ